MAIRAQVLEILWARVSLLYYQCLSYKYDDTIWRRRCTRNLQIQDMISMSRTLICAADYRNDCNYDKRNERTKNKTLTKDLRKNCIKKKQEICF